jgi:hypothetical protein
MLSKNIMKKISYILLSFLFSVSLYAQWTQLNVIPGGKVYSLAAIGNKILTGSDSGVRVSSDNGNTWYQSDLKYYKVLSFTSAGNRIFAGTLSGGTFVSTNTGNNWTQTNMNSNGGIYSLTTSTNRIFAGTGAGLYSTTNYGSNWVYNPLGYIAVSLLAKNNEIYAGANYNHGLHYSSNEGSSWAQIGLNGYSVNCVTVNSNYVFAGTYQHGIYRSSNNGGTWLHTLSESIYSFAVYGNYIFAGTEYVVYLSANNGADWVIRTEGFNNIIEVYSLLIANNYIFAGTCSSAWRRPLSEIIGINNISENVPSSFSLIQNYPNPFNPTTNIRYQIKNTGIIKLVICNILGNELQALINEKQSPGTYEVKWDASAYPSGIYFCKITAGDFSDIKKMMLIK